MVYSEGQYEAAIQSLFERHQSVATAGFSADAYKPGLEAMKEFDASLGNPSRGFRSIHVAGTNGKGSVCSMLAASLAATGLKVGLYTSPHLTDFRERMKIVEDGRFRMISRDEVMDFIERAELGSLSFFEVTTGIAFDWFAREKVDLAVIEVGLGGRLDSTNIITPELSIVTSIGLDHCAILGNTRAEIAAEKAGIFKKGVPALVWGHDCETDSVFLKAAAEAGCPLHFASERATPGGISLQNSLQSICGAINLPTVLKALDILGTPIHPDALAGHCRITGFHGRWEELRPGVFCDIGHNPAALKVNFDRLRSLGRPMAIVYGVMADKDYRTNISLIPEGAQLFLCEPSTPRALGIQELEKAFMELRPELSATISGSPSGSVGAAVDAALERAAANPETVILICGSTFVVSEAVQHMNI